MASEPTEVAQEKKKKKTHRELRMEANERKCDPLKKGDLRVEDGPLEGYERNAWVSGDTLCVKVCDENGRGLYLDDGLGILRDLLHAQARALDDAKLFEALNLVQQALEVMDQRAVECHGYSHNEREKNYRPSKHRYIRSPHPYEGVFLHTEQSLPGPSNAC